MKRKFGCGPGLLGLGLLLAFVVGEHYLAIYIDERRFPWATPTPARLHSSARGSARSRPGAASGSPCCSTWSSVPLGRTAGVRRSSARSATAGSRGACSCATVRGACATSRRRASLTMVGRRAFILRRAPPTARRRRGACTELHLWPVGWRRLARARGVALPAAGQIGDHEERRP